MAEIKKSYKCKYCDEVFEKPLLLAHHVRSKHKRAKRIEKRKVEKAGLSEQINNQTVEAIGILRGLRASPNLSEEEKKLLQEISKRLEELLVSAQGIK